MFGTAAKALKLAEETASKQEAHEKECLAVRKQTAEGLSRVEGGLTDISKFLGRIQIYLIAVLGSIVAYFLIHYVIERPVTTINTTTEHYHEAPRP